MSPRGRTQPAGFSRPRLLLIVLGLILVTAATAVGLSTMFGESGIEESPEFGETGERVRTDGERCAVPLWAGWNWRPASWSLETPLGTTIGFYETLHGRPLYAEWDEMIDEMVGRYEEQSAVTIQRSDDELRIDFGPGGGMSVVKRFDRVGCHLTFSPASSEVRAEEESTWEALIDSVERTYPQE